MDFKVELERQKAQKVRGSAGSAALNSIICPKKKKKNSGRIRGKEDELKSVNHGLVS